MWRLSKIALNSGNLLANSGAPSAIIGRARTLHEMSNDAFGVARVDLNLGAVALDHG